VRYYLTKFVQLDASDENHNDYSQTFMIRFNMLCDVCISMLSQHKGLIWAGSLTPLSFEHHKSTKTLRQSLTTHCAICTGIAKVLSRDIDLQQDQPVAVRANLTTLQRQRKDSSDSTFELTFKLCKNRERTFLLNEIGKSKQHRSFSVLLTYVDPTRRVVPQNKTSHNVVETAQKWIKKCNCAKSWEQPGERWYPRRLLDLEDLRNNPGDLQRAKMRLIESNEHLDQRTAGIRGRYSAPRRVNDRYVTLSHCWGEQKPGLVPLKLTFETERRFENEGIRLQELPKTFRDAVVFASRLDKVGFMWIDSLCIRQPIGGPGVNSDEQLKDWFEQSRYMGTVYEKAFLNISATASSDGSGGLFFDPRPDHLWENNVNVYYPNQDPRVPKKATTAELDAYKRCTVIEVSAWDDLVKLAPVNRRGWVFQERLLAPRVLHFCHNQVAWECSEFQVAEGITQAQLAVIDSSIGQEGRLKHLTASAGRTFREARLQGMSDPDQHLKHVYIFELWRKVVEDYSRTQLTNFGDKLIALAGIAKHFQENLLSSDPTCRYVAGLWSRHLESQLLWYVNEVYEGDGVFDNPA
jgi:hypothetical protein